MGKIKIGVCEFCFPVSGPAAIRMAAEAGFEGMQLSDCGGSGMSYPFLKSYIQDLYLNAAEDNGITFQALHLQTLFNQKYMKEAPASEAGRSARLSLENGARVCHDMGIPTMMITITQIMNKEQYAYSVDSLKYAVEVCDKYGVTLAMENDLDAASFLKLRSDVGDGLHLCFDTMNMVVNGIDYPENELARYDLSVIDHFHVKDCVENANGFMTKYTTPFTLIGEGKTHFKEWAEAIRKTSYDGWVISESFYTDPVFAPADYIDLAKKDVETLRAALN